MRELYGQPYDKRDQFWVVKCYMDMVYLDGFFVRAVDCIVRKIGFSIDGAYCSFPDLNSFFDEEHFVGVEFSCGYPPTQEDTVLVSEVDCAKLVRLSCDKYIALHPEDEKEISTILNQCF